MYSRGTAIARIVANNVKNFEEFDNTVNMYVFEEMIDGRKLSEIINTEHENVKYLPGFKIPDNVVSRCVVSIFIIVLVYTFILSRFFNIIVLL